MVDHFELQREVVQISMNFLDRCIANVRDECARRTEEGPHISFTSCMTNRRYQLLSLTCLYMAIKLNEYYHLRLPTSSGYITESTLDAVLRLSNGYFNRAQMEATEYEVLQRLQWRLHPPTAQQCLHLMVASMASDDHPKPYDGSVLDLSLFLIELSTMDYFFVTFRPSEVALAALAHASGRHDEFYLPGADRVHIAACRKRLAYLHAAQGDEPQAQPMPPIGSGAGGRTTSPVSVVP